MTPPQPHNVLTPSSRPPVVDSGSTAHVGPVIPLQVRYKGRPLPLRTVASGGAAVRAMIGGKLNPDLPLLTLKHDGVMIVYTLRDLKLAP